MLGKYKDDVPKILSPDREEARAKRHGVSGVSWELSNNQVCDLDQITLFKLLLVDDAMALPQLTLQSGGSQANRTHGSISEANFQSSTCFGANHFQPVFGGQTPIFILSGGPTPNI